MDAIEFAAMHGGSLTGFQTSPLKPSGSRHCRHYRRKFRRDRRGDGHRLFGSNGHLLGNRVTGRGDAARDSPLAGIPSDDSGTDVLKDTGARWCRACTERRLERGAGDRPL
ncbi:MAG: hypothetical protein HKL99_01930 [Burkholderiales bacterium]|nr:hypothetical protein [Burkholderiales bacterium]